jgi:hypothetical protein
MGERTDPPGQLGEALGAVATTLAGMILWAAEHA